MRTLAFNIFFYLATFIYGLSCLICSLIPGRKALMGALKRYTKIMVWGMRRIGGMDIEVRGKANIPASGPVIIASKHQSQFKDLSFVTGDHLEKFWGLKRILTKMNAVVIDSCGGSDSQAKMEEQAAAVRTEGRRLLIFPEGHLSRVGTHHRYRKGVWHLQQDFNCPVIPVANTLGQRWNQSDWAKFAGKAVVEFMEPIQPGLDKEAFMELLQDKIEGQSIALLDLENLGALNPADIGKEEENHVALAKRLAREEKAV